MSSPHRNVIVPRFVTVPFRIMKHCFMNGVKYYLHEVHVMAIIDDGQLEYNKIHQNTYFTVSLDFT